MPELDRHEPRLVFEVVAIELRAQKKGIRLSSPVLGLHEAQQAFDPRCGRLPTTGTPLHRVSLLAVRLPDKVGRRFSQVSAEKSGDRACSRRPR
jgi:hypothetical protein